MLCQGICVFIKQFHIGAANPMFCLIESFLTLAALEKRCAYISVTKGMELTLRVFFIYKM
ncbi:hypothetical protein AAGG74_09115 [Bacillus mexicanus]|uniref:hypothetical protein n=1 Tax=Bacillus mexicanus TaxID=2834415 RepID=UPI003D24F99C